MQKTHYTSVHIPKKAHNAFQDATKELQDELAPKHLKFCQVIAAMLCNIPKEEVKKAIKTYATSTSQ